MKQIVPFLFLVIIIGVIVAVGIGLNKDRKKLDSTASPSSTTTQPATTLSQRNAESGIDATSLAKYLTQTGAEMYGAYWCSHCKEQKELFGDAFQYIKYIECDPKGENPQVDKCTAAGISGYPTWIINGKQSSGAKTFTELKELSGYQGN